MKTYAANADGSIIKTATEVTTSCSGGTTTECPGGSTTTQTLIGGTCPVDDKPFLLQIDTYCTACGGRIACELKYVSNCSHYTGTSSTTGTFSHSTISKPCTHGKTSSHTVYTGTYKNEAYGYSGSSSTFKVWPITITGVDGATATITVTGATSTDAAISGKTITVKVGGLSTGYPVKITNSATGDSSTVTVGGTAHTFVMPAKVVNLTIEPAKQPQTITVQTTFNVAYNQAPFNLNATVSS